MKPPRWIVLVEGNSDAVALRTLAPCRGRDLDAEGVEVVADGGITNTRAFATRYGPHGLGLPLAGLYDVGERAVPRRGWWRQVSRTPPHRTSSSGWASDACDRDLEDELLRALGTAAVAGRHRRGR